MIPTLELILYYAAKDATVLIKAVPIYGVNDQLSNMFVWGMLETQDSFEFYGAIQPSVGDTETELIRLIMGLISREPF